MGSGFTKGSRTRISDPEAGAAPPAAAPSGGCRLLLVRLPALALVLAGLTALAGGTNTVSPDKVRSTRDFGPIRREVETLRGKKFRREVPVFTVSNKELRAITERELDKQWPGAKLPHYEELLAWMDMAPPHTDLKTIYGDFSADQVAGFYVDQTKEICIPAAALGASNAVTGKKFQQSTPEFDNIVLSHEFTHALEDQYWPLDVAADYDETKSTDRGTAHDFVAEGSATREMIEAVPDQFSDGTPDRYFLLWNWIHSGPGEAVLDYACRNAWKSSKIAVAGVPDTLARDELIPYSYGYCFCARIMRDWGLDGLDYIYAHPVISSAQVMHPKKAWQWHDWPVQIDLPKSLPGDWKQISLDTQGEADTAILFGCQFHNLNRGLEIARGWNGDHIGLYEGPKGRRLLLWASSWDSKYHAGLFFTSCIKERQAVHQAVVTTNDLTRAEWKSPDGRFGFIRREGKRVIVVETDGGEARPMAQACMEKITFTEPPERASRDAANSSWRRFNPFWSWQKDGDYVVTRSLGGILSRHDRNSVGAADSYLGGVLAESRRTASFRKWEVGGGWIALHESEARRGFSKTTVLPWGILASHCSARYPQKPDKTLAHSSLLWGALASVSTDAAERHSVHVLPFGLLYCRTTSPGLSSTYILGTGSSRKDGIKRFRVLGIPFPRL